MANVARSHRTVFVSSKSFDDAVIKANMAGYTPVSHVRNPKTDEYVVIAVSRRFFQTA